MVFSNEKTPYIGKCWPGLSYWADFLNPKTLELYKEFFKDESYFLNATNLHTWIDMNEPAVFEAPEKTFPRDNMHFNGSEYIYHRDIHNSYGQLYQKTTYESLKNRYDNKKRVFVLSRAFYTGTQKYGFIWTGDNRSDFDFLRYSVPTLQTLCACGINAVGSDIGGFYGVASEALLRAWYKIGIFYPFYRGHSDFSSKAREPYLHSQETVESIRNSIRLRYHLLSYIYTKFFEHCLTGANLIKPLYLDIDFFSKFSENENFYLKEVVKSTFIFADEFIVAPYFEQVIEPVVSVSTNATALFLANTQVTNTGTATSLLDTNKLSKELFTSPTLENGVAPEKEGETEEVEIK